VQDAVPLVVGSATGNQWHADVIGGTGQYLVVWQDDRAGSSAGPNDVYGGRVTSTGSILDPGGFAISQLATDETIPVIAFDGTSGYLALYQRRDLSAGANRVFGRTISFSALGNGSSCSSASQCTSGNCVDSVCCDSVCGGGSANDCQACSMAT